MFGGNFAPRGWALCNGQLLAISTNTALFSILGTTYGGNGTTTFGLPDLRGRSAMHWGQGNGLTPRSLGEMSGTETVTLITAQIPAHVHPLSASTANGTTDDPTGAVLGKPSDSDGNPVSAYNTTINTAMNPAAVGVAGGSQPHSNMAPYLCLSFIVALEGVFPSRN